MFERYTEHARRVIFFARYEASAFGSDTIESEHLLLGLLREDSRLRARVTHAGIEAIRKAIEAQTPPRPRTSTSVDIPLSDEARRALVYGAQEADALGHKHVDCPHLVLGLLRFERSIAASQLLEHGVNAEAGREMAETPVKAPLVEFYPEARGEAFEEPRTPEAATPALQPTIDKLRALIDGASDRLQQYSDAFGDKPLKRKAWSRKQALGHAIDWGAAHQQWIARALTEPKIVAHGYPLEEWVEAQKYAQCRWEDLVVLWIAQNRVLLQVIAAIPEQRAKIECRIGLDAAIPLAELVNRYVGYCEDLTGQILARL